MLGVFEIVSLCLFILFVGALGTLLVLKLHFTNKEIKELEDKLGMNRKEREQIEQNIERLKNYLKEMNNESSND